MFKIKKLYGLSALVSVVPVSLVVSCQNKQVESESGNKINYHKENEKIESEILTQYAKQFDESIEKINKNSSIKVENDASFSTNLLAATLKIVKNKINNDENYHKYLTNKKIAQDVFLKQSKYIQDLLLKGEFVSPIKKFGVDEDKNIEKKENDFKAFIEEFTLKTTQATLKLSPELDDIIRQSIGIAVESIYKIYSFVKSQLHKDEYTKFLNALEYTSKQEAKSLDEIFKLFKNQIANINGIIQEV